MHHLLLVITEAFLRTRCAFFALAVLVFFAPDAVADVAPTEYAGSNVVPVDTSEIRMEEARVDLFWGTPWKLTAVFVLNNETLKPTAVQLGFPMLVPGGFREDFHKKWPGFKIAFDGAPAVASEIMTVTLPDDEPRYREADTWYRCQHTFQPGKTAVTIEASFPASLTYGLPYQERLFYCIQTGGKWKGTIGCEEVNLHFPASVNRDQVLDAVPANYVVRGDVVQWRFLDFKPKGREFDISFRYLRPDIFKILLDLRSRLAADPTNSALTIRLAKDLFALGPSKGNPGYAPPSLAPGEFQTILGQINDPRDRAYFRAKYVAGYDAYLATLKDSQDRTVLASSYESTKARLATTTDPDVRAQCGRLLQRYREDFWCRDLYDKPQDEIIRILSAASYKGLGSKYPAVEEAQNLIERLLKAEPMNAEAWNVLLANYCRIGFNAVGPSRCGCEQFYPRQIDLIKRAHEECPQDAAIGMWVKRCNLNDFRGEGEDGLSELLKKSGVFDTDFPKIHYGYY